MPLKTQIPLSGPGLDRAAHRRADLAWLKDARQAPDVLVLLMQGGKPLIEGGRPEASGAVGAWQPPASRPIAWLGAEAWTLGDPETEVFLGVDRRGTPAFALNMPEPFSLAGSPIEGLGAFEDMRAAAQGLSALEGSAAATARSLFEWHRRHGFCANCGAPTQIVEAGWKRACRTCGAEHFPRTDPVAIMLATDGERCLVGRQRAWPPGFVSCLAGFVEPGETVEQAAARELYEEAGITADPAEAEYLFCQPWPFPSSLMVGLILPAVSTEITVDTSELETAHWVTRDEARQMIAGDHPRFTCPPPMAVAHHILKVWAERS